MISQWHAKLPVLSCLAKKLVDISGDPSERQWLHQRLPLAVVRGNTASILVCVQVWSDFSHHQCINQCPCPSLASLQCIAIALRMSVFSVSVIVFGMFFMLSVKPPCSTVLLPFSAILTNLILFIFHVPNTTVLLFTVKPFCNLSLPLSAQPHLGVLCAWSNTHTMAVLHHGLYNFTVFFFFGNVWFYFILVRKKLLYIITQRKEFAEK